jgi:glycosyltransferase involved in cell wall biosynthesis
MPRVSVIVPSYNHGRFLARRLDSVLAQTYRDFEVIFLDDASTDDSLAVFARYRDLPLVRTFVNAVNSGSPFKQWNRGVSEARGDYVWIAESDDACEPTFLEALISILDARPEVGLAYSGSQMLDEAGRPWDGPIAPGCGDIQAWLDAVHPTRWHADFVADGREECRRYLVQRNTIPNASAVVFRKRLYERVGGADENMRMCGDWLMWVRLLLESDVAYVAARLNHFRMAHNGSVRGRMSQALVVLEEWLTIIHTTEERAELPPDVRARVLAVLGDEWLRLVHHAGPADAAAGGQRVLEAARRAGPDFWATLLSATSIQCARVPDLLQAVHELTRRLDQLDAEVRSQMHFWERLRQALVPRGGWLHRLARALDGMRKRAA